MAEVTRVPLQPIAKGSLTKMWLGVLAAVLLSAGIAWAAMPPGVGVDEITAGTGAMPTEDSVVWVKYTGKLEDGTVFDQSQQLDLPIEGIFPEGTPLPLSDMIPGMREALMQVQKGGKYEIFIPSDKAYGDNVPEGGPIPPGADLYFDIEVIEVMARADFDQRMAQFQQRMMEQQAEGAEGGAAAPAPAPQQ